MLRVIAVGAQNAQYKEADAAEAITPGHLVALDGSNKAIKHNIADVAAAAGVQFVGPVSVAVENDQMGGGLDDAYAINDRVLYAQLKPGNEFYGLVAAAAPAIALHDYLASAGNGTLRKTVVKAEAVGRALQAVDNSGGGAAVRIRTEVLA
jgi:hypothetical protein